ncbi:putative bifunctional diguanylate cyclase/phosphodiesterase [Crocosphaera chwakensis]|uniref:Putative diguanylate cyclase/phosphodiesterase (GGDEF & EAL domains) with Response Regulator Receiver modulation n=1 Tax=Crocosphaera chwakensis CCY0110 TaxID=391612 RepID=A3ISA8_9CHRO|nr:GGDEF domain-containing response regulator [Crocosphaera chwakensis]EAZ90624.1 Putative diguanylate cyclase/phosphodiesterase (GGDEF & EAL domains) with Response Regulator Receiver modulation [Crocosphaera chwakensis CCY0110]
MINPYTSQPSANILIVDDKPPNLRILSTMLVKAGYKVRAVTSGNMALTAAKTMPPDIILLDIKMPDIDGYQVCQELKQFPETAEIPVIFLSALQDVEDKVKAFEAGGVDYIIKPFQFEEVRARVSLHLTFRQTRYQLQQLNQELEKRVEERSTDLLKAQEELLFHARHDSLTELANRLLFLERVDLALKRVHEENNYTFAVLVIDLDRFKRINDSEGHIVGDRLLVEVSRSLETLVSPADTVARLGGDEFAILLDPIDDVNEALKVAQQVKTTLTTSFFIQDKEVFTSPSIGLSISHRKYQSAIEILQDADIAMGQAKEKGRGRYEIFNQKMHAQALKLLTLETDLRHGIDKEEFKVYYQPIMQLNPIELVGFEALIRWQHPYKGFISPGEFIPVAENTGLIIPLGTIVLEKVCHQIKIWNKKYPHATSLKVAVNFSSKQFNDVNLVKNIDEVLEKMNLNSNNLKIEITETSLIEHSLKTIKLVKELKKRNLEICLDDFGTGYSSLSYLHRFPVDILKIDRSFINSIGQPEENLEIIQSIITLAHNLGMKVVAEGIETEEQLIYLQQLNCDFGQGYFFNRPLPPAEVEKLLETN